MQNLESFDKFYTSVENLGDKLKSIDDSLNEKRNILKKEVTNFNNQVQNFKIDKKYQKNKEIYNVLQTVINSIKASSENWVEKFYNLLENEKFRSELSNYFILVIFGKVKAGKSTLGNFIANSSNLKPKFFKYDEAGKKQETKKLEEIDNNEFKTDLLEATKEIQGFILGGLAWIDTPGIHSLTKENEKLAKDYINAADLIIFPTSSDSPLQSDEINELKELFKENKKVVILITKSDTVIEDECECGSEDGCEKCDGGLVRKIVNKSNEIRKKQEDEIYNRMLEIVDDDKNLIGDIISISSFTAKLGLKNNDEELFINSNMPKFYDLIRNILEKKAATLKGNKPYEELEAFIEKILEDLEYIKKVINNSKQNFKKIEKKLNTKKDNTRNEIFLIVNEIIEKNKNEINKINYKNKFKQITDDVSNEFEKKLKENIEEILTDVAENINQIISSIDLNFEDLNIKDKYKKIHLSTKDRNSKIGAAVFGTIGAIAGSFIPGVGNVVGSMAGGAIGGWIGSKIGEWTGDYEEIEIYVGDNKEEIILNFQDKLIKEFENITIKTYENINNDFLIPLNKFIDEKETYIKEFETNLKNIKEQLC